MTLASPLQALPPAGLKAQAHLQHSSVSLKVFNGCPTGGKRSVKGFGFNQGLHFGQHWVKVAAIGNFVTARRAALADQASPGQLAPFTPAHCGPRCLPRAAPAETPACLCLHQTQAGQLVRHIQGQNGQAISRKLHG